MKNILLIAATISLACLTVQAEEQFAYKCILNTPEIPKFNFEKSFPKQMREALMRAPYAGYVVVKVSTKANENGEANRNNQF
ncbi:MAG: hypothetical protein M3O82_09455 [Verrucomicrobiota bacterium]|nr:hypothetical protein [Verrucomicrobiota bacterium]